MIKIAHRGNLNGPNSETENEPHQIVGTISTGVDVEVDIWRTDDDKLFLGHDEPKFEIDESFIEDIMENAWFHCKNLNALHFFKSDYPEAKFFWHQEDDYTLTSNGYIWTYPGKEITDKSIIVVLDKAELPKYIDSNAYGICSDYMYL